MTKTVRDTLRASSGNERADQKYQRSLDLTDIRPQAGRKSTRVYINTLYNTDRIPPYVANLYHQAQSLHRRMSISPVGSADHDRLSESEYRDRLRELPPSAKLVAKVLEGESPLSQGGLAEESLLPDRTVRYALNRLEEEELVDSRYSFKDARKQVYFLTI